MSLHSNQSTQIDYLVEMPPERVPREARGDALISLLTSPYDENRVEGPCLVRELARCGSGISIAMSSLDDKTGQAIRILQGAGVPVVGWVVNDDTDGYFTNAASVSSTEGKVSKILDWSEEQGVRFSALGLDLERPLQVLKAIGCMNLVGVARTMQLYRQARSREILKHGDPQRYMDRLVRHLHVSGIQTETYEMPGFLKYIMGDGLSSDVGWDQGRIVEMLYTSPMPLVRLLLLSLRNRRTTPALGIVTGISGETPGRDLSGGKPTNHLDAMHLAQDIGVVLNQGQVVHGETVPLRRMYVFALNGPRSIRIAKEAMRLAIKMRSETRGARFGVGMIE